MSFILTWKTHVICFVISIITVIIFYPMISSILISFFSSRFILYPTSWYMVNYYLFSFVLIIPISIVHEAIHGFFHILYGGKVKYGFKGIYAYTVEVSQRALERNKFIVVLLSPLVLISLISLILLSPIGGMVFLINLLGSSGDIFMTLYVLRLKKNTKIIDKSYGFDVVLE